MIVERPWAKTSHSMSAAFYPEHQALGRIKEFTWYFSLNLPFGHQLAVRMQNLSTLAVCRDLVELEFVRCCGF